MRDRALFRWVYQKLAAAYGPQGWWPVADAGSHTATYRKRRHLSPAQQFEVMVGTILTQNTAWKNVEPALQGLRAAHALSVDVLGKIPQRKLARIIRSSGYHNQKADRLKRFANFLCAHPIAELAQLPIPELRALLLAQHGIGPETADSIILYAFGKPSFVIDAYTKRIFARLEGTQEQSYDALQQRSHAALPHHTPRFNAYHALLVQHAKQHCRKQPLCAGCPLRSCCAHAKRDGSVASRR